MNDKDKEFVEKFERVLLLLGIGTSIIFQEKISKDDKQWWLTAIQEVIYNNKPIPLLTMPERKK